MLKLFWAINSRRMRAQKDCGPGEEVHKPTAQGATGQVRPQREQLREVSEFYSGIHI